MSGDFTMPFGKYEDQTLDTIASSEEGLLYLDWLVGQEWFRGPTRRQLEAFLAQDDVRAELDRLLEEN